MRKRFYDDPDSPGMNEKRAGWAEDALLTFARATGMNLDEDADGPETVASDLLADLAHYCDRNGLRLRTLMRNASTHYIEETGNQGRQFARRSTRADVKRVADERTRIGSTPNDDGLTYTRV